MNIIWKVIQSKWTVVLQLERIVLQSTLCVRYFTTGGQSYFSLNRVCYSERYVQYNAQQVESSMAV